jgi:hypothetical protein
MSGFRARINHRHDALERRQGVESLDEHAAAKITKGAAE